MNKIPPCPICNEEFQNIFEAADHLLEENEEEFDPKLILPNGYSLMIGSLLRRIYELANYPEDVMKVCESTYGILYAAETNPGAMKNIIQDIVVDQNMANIDEELKNLINDTESGE